MKRICAVFACLSVVLSLDLPSDAASPGAVPARDFSLDVKDFLKKGAVETPPLPEARGGLELDGLAGDAIQAFFPGLTKGQVPGVVQGVAQATAKAKGVAKATSKRTPSDGEMQDDVRLSPLTTAEREAAVKELFRKAGAADIQTQELADLGQNNVVVVKKGRTDRLIVFGAHHDKALQGDGVIDNWTGAAMVVNLYKALKDMQTEHTLVFASFGGEENGLVGSAEFVSRLSDEDRKRVDAMINFDCLAVDGTFSWKNNSDRSMLDAAKKAATSGGLELKEVTFWGGDADSSSFRDAGIQAVTIFGASPGIIFDIVHSGNDTFGKFSLPHFKNAYSLGLGMTKALDARGAELAGRTAPPKPAS